MAATEFDELDKAVASVLGTPDNDTPTPVEQEKPIEVPPARDDKPVEEKREAPTIAPRMRRSGRFMDMVHTSSDMRPTQPTPPSAPVSELKPVASEPIEKPHDYTQPDPLEFHGFSDILPPKPVVKKEPAIEPPAEEPEEDPPVEESNEPLTTPFLPDAKVEKRPLGAFSDTPKTVEELPLLEASPLPIETVETTKPEASEPAKDETLPAELHTDLLSIEALEADHVQPDATPTDDIPVVPSIVQQYKEKPNSDAKPTAAIYDTEAVHVPLAHAPKKRQGWLVVVWIAALVLVGGGIGVAMYYVVLPMLG